MRHKDHFLAGFTLIEVMVVVLLASVIFAALFMVMSSGRTIWSTADTQISLQGQLRQAMRQITRDLRSSGTSQISIPANGTSYSSISFNVSQGVGGSGAINWSSAPVNFSLSAGQIIRSDGTTTRVLANNITSLLFLRQATSSEVVRINMSTSRSSVYGRTLNATLDSAIVLRN